ncbi:MULTISPECIES: DUF3397 domain-containing protein [Neobacillus]|uniref:DUF3397 domain-containing protein n=1 Tax=Neobacillus rhizophilus TaxID=2833579 RepID=A0A942YUG9_9BACI|nr:MULTISPECIES: DUF3397 domain-containing protein [Neobacillus]MBS4211950.1 DUF3397 domain-containing protein [Neobacillus rhizophilus]MBU8915382.1 DUF3397 domain-containing protein [Bacillus sp. FJAT-29953]
MSSILSTLLTLLFIMPFLGFLLVFLVFKLITNDTRKSVHHALDYSTILFIISVHFLVKTIWGNSFFWIILLVMIFIAIIFVVVHWKVKDEIILTKVMKGFWRFNFLLFFLAYISLTLFGVIHRAIIFSLAS